MEQEFQDLLIPVCRRAQRAVGDYLALMTPSRVRELVPGAIGSVNSPNLSKRFDVNQASKVSCVKNS